MRAGFERHPQTHSKKGADDCRSESMSGMIPVFGTLPRGAEGVARRCLHLPSSFFRIPHGSAGWVDEASSMHASLPLGIGSPELMVRIGSRPAGFQGKLVDRVYQRRVGAQNRGRPSAIRWLLIQGISWLLTEKQTPNLHFSSLDSERVPASIFFESDSGPPVGAPAEAEVVAEVPPPFSSATAESEIS